MYNSCGDRNCPRCAGARRADWLDSTAELLLPNVDYFQVVFTLPYQLSSLALGNRRELCNLLFRSAWAALRQTIEEEQGFEPAAAMVLHTWNQKLDSHVHVHALVPGGGPSLGGPRRWIKSRCRSGRRRHGPHLVEATELRKRFRKLFLDGLRRLHRNRALKLEGEWSHLQEQTEFEKLIAKLNQVTWVTYIEPPPCEDSRPEHVLKYLARYMTGGPISNRRLISHTDGEVTFWARTGKNTKPGELAESRPYTLSGTEFARRWALHILPRGYTRSRYYGGYSNRHRKRYLGECRELLGTPAETEQPRNEPARDKTCRCPKCDGPLVQDLATDHPRWNEVMAGRDRPWWYRDG